MQAATTRTLKFFNGMYIAGRVDDYLIALRAGSTYTIKLNLNQFCSPATKEFELNVPPGKFLITANFEGKGAQAVNLDTQGIKLMNFWLGKAQSNTLTIEP
jgi:hypothetical protein